METLLLLFLLPATVDEHTVSKTIRVDGRLRRYRLHVPPSYRADTAVPLVVMLHGGGSRAAHMERFTGFSALSDREGFIVAYPDAVSRNWNDGRGAKVIKEQIEGVDDVKFIAALLEKVGRDCRIDPRRVYAVGPSNGGIMSLTLALRMSDRFAAVACVIGGLAKPLENGFRPEKPISILMMNGTEDPLVPFAGGAVARNRGEVLGTRRTIELWARHNRCAAVPKREELPDRAQEDGCTVVRETWSGGAAGTEVVLYTIRGGGHTWPGGPQYLPERWIGRVCRDLDGTRTIWEFLKGHPKR